LRHSGGQFIQTLGRQTSVVTTEVTTEVTPEVRLARVLVGEMTRQQLQAALGLQNDEHFRKAYLQPALDAGLIELTIPDKPRSSEQRYRLTAKGATEGAKGT
jgi:ATP-dependent DNA helicase RecG